MKSSSSVLLSKVVMCELLSDWINYRKELWSRTNFINFLLLWLLFVLFFSGKSHTFRPPKKPVSDSPYLFERVVKFL